jgi:predicted transcriptional regulator
MNDFNKVFLAIKKQVEKQNKLAEVGFQSISKDSKIPIKKLPEYLDYLQDAGLIKYSTDEQYIYLTAFGKKQESLVKE